MLNRRDRRDRRDRVVRRAHPDRSSWASRRMRAPG